MNEQRATRFGVWGRRIGFGVGALIAIIAGVVILFDGNWLRGPIERQLSHATGHAATIRGNIRARFWSWTPTLEIQNLVIANPDWAEKPALFSAPLIRVSVSLPHLLRGETLITELVVTEPQADLERVSEQRRNWAPDSAPASAPGRSADDAAPAPRLPAIRRLVIRGGRVRIVDEVRRLRMEASVLAGDAAPSRSSRDPDALSISAHGVLNRRPFALDATGGSLLNLAPDRPYTIKVSVQAADIHARTELRFAHPFDFRSVTGSVSASGRDLADLYYLTGLALPNTPPYRVSAGLRIDGPRIGLQDIDGHLGSSDVHGRVGVVLGGARPKLTALIESRSLRLSDLAATLGQPEQPSKTQEAGAALGAATARPRTARTVSTARTAQLLPSAELQVNRLRGMDADVTYVAGTVIAPKIPMKEVRAHVTLDNGRLNVDPVSLVLQQGRFGGSVQIDARSDTPDVQIDLRLDDVELTQFKSQKLKTAPFAGLLVGRIQLQGTGTSVHAVGASANGRVSLIIPQGEINEAIAELTEINVARGLGLLLSKPTTRTAIRCGAADFEAHGGRLQSKVLYIDTQDVLITGQGSINLNDERLDLALQGDPKKLRLTRLRTPITIKGTLADPDIGVDAGKLAKQGAVATAIGTLLTPLAALITFVAPGRAHDQDCAAVRRAPELPRG